MKENMLSQTSPAPLFVYMDKIGIPKVLDSAEAAAFCADGWKHIATLDPKTYLQTVLDKNPKLVAALNASK